MKYVVFNYFLNLYRYLLFLISYDVYTVSHLYAKHLGCFLGNVCPVSTWEAVFYSCSPIFKSEEVLYLLRILRYKEIGISHLVSVSEVYCKKLYLNLLRYSLI